jgi:prepilin-type N-terminal cleavage/methylation domain-containing protein
MEFAMHRAASPRRRGFTLIELLVVVAILATLIAILIPTLGRARDMAKKTICATNLKGQGNAFAIFASSHSDLLPSDAGGNWLHDVNATICDTLVGTQLSGTQSASSIRRWFYCPTNSDANTDWAWYATQYPNPINYNIVPAYRWLDYAYFNQRGLGTTLPTNASPNGRLSGKPPKLVYRTKMISTFMSSDAELVADEILTTIASATTGDFSVPNNNSYFHEYSSHLRGAKPQGENVLACDGHVSWREWNTAATPISQQGGGNYFWIVDP